MKFSDYITENMQTLLHKKLALEAKLQKTKRNSNRQKILDELKAIDAQIQKDYGAISNA